MQSDVIRARLADAGFSKYSDAILREWTTLQSLSSAEANAHLKAACGVATLGARHRMVTLLAEVAAEPRAPAPAADLSEPPDISEPASPSMAATPAPLPPHLSALVTACPAESGADTERRNNVMGLSGTLPPGEPLRVNLHYPGLHRVHAHPPIYLVDDFLTAAECDALTRLADPLLRQSLTDGGASRVRTSRSCHLRKGSQPCPSLMRKAALLTNKPPSHMETPQVARYEKGEFYEPHFDGAAPRQQRSEYERGQGGQRVATILVYLNDVPAGGRTRFNALGLEVAPRKGCAIVFFPCFADTGTLDPRALHEARPAVDRKYVCQLWVRQCELPPAMQEHEGVGHRLLEALYAPQ